MLKGLMFRALVGFYGMELVSSGLSPSAAALLQSARNMICLLYSLPLVDLSAPSPEGAIRSTCQAPRGVLAESARLSSPGK